MKPVRTRWVPVSVQQEALLPALSPQSVSSPPRAPADRPGFYGFGFNVGVSAAGRVTLSHSGGFYLGAATNVFMLPSVGVGIVVLSNAAPVGAVEAVALAFMDLVQEGHPVRDWLSVLSPIFAHFDAPLGHLAGQAPPSSPAPARPLADYAGTYANDYFGSLEIKAEGDRLALVIGPSRLTYALDHWTGDSFVFSPSGENAPMGSRSEVVFHLAGDRAQSVTVEFWNNNQLGTFSR